MSQATTSIPGASTQPTSGRPSVGGGALAEVGLVVIGRNEGKRLLRCLDGLPRGLRQVVYVDSGSTDGSQAEARRRGVDVVDLDMSVPFTAARARNAGFDRMLHLHPTLEMVHFLDGDCELVPGWIEAAVAEMKSAPDIVAVCGWLRERHPERSPFNAICDIEWRNGPLGDTTAFGGIVLIRAAALRAVGGYNPDVIAAEDDEVGLRMRQAGGRFRRIDRVSALHDADITRLGQWWTRAKRCGHAYAQVADMHGRDSERYFVREVRRSWQWGLGLPAAAALLAPPTLGLSLGLLAAYPVQALRTYQSMKKRGFTTRDSALWGLSCTAAKFPESVGILKYHLDKLRRQRPTIIEYKGQPNT